jgi:hypothetical protein
VTDGWRKPNPKWAFLPEHDDLIRDAYNRTHRFGQRGALARVAQRIGYPKHAIVKRGKTLGLTRAKEKPWSDPELQMLRDMAQYTAAVIAKKMREAGFERSEAAVVLKRKRLRLKQSIEGAWTAHQLAEAMGEDGHKVARWITRGMLRAERLGTRRAGPQHGDTYWIRREDVLTFLFDHPDEYDLAKVDKFWFLELFSSRINRQGEETTLP